MYAVLKMIDKTNRVLQVADGIFDQMKADFRAADKTEVYDLLDGGVARVSWREVESLERHEEDPNRIIVGSLGGDGEGPTFTAESMKVW